MVAVLRLAPLVLDNDNNNKARRCKSMSDRPQNVQDVFLNHVRKNKVPVTIFLVNGVKLQGIISWFDNFCLLLRRDAHVQLVYKHAISTVMPSGPINLFEAAQPTPEAAAQPTPAAAEEPA